MGGKMSGLSTIIPINQYDIYATPPKYLSTRKVNNF